MRRFLVLLLLVAWPNPGRGQAHVDPAAADVPRTILATPAGTGTRAVATAPVPELLASPAGAFTASLVLPGAGQAALGLRRWVVYGLLEAGLWAVHIEAAADVRRLTDAYRDLAWARARLPTGPGQRQEAGWGYYETMGHYVRSGSYDRDPQTAGVQPETDAATYNGTIWALAQGIYLPAGTGTPASEEYQEAIAYYRDRAAGPDFLWDWTGGLDAMDRYRGLITDADDEARVRSAALGLVLANHLVAAVDALVTARLRAGTRVRLESRLIPSPAPRLDVGLRIPIRN